jgi:GrpB-like predicted nucleotidyltransferase (UPF0157 family)/quercetin dioxygenase-like cupin family protein
VEVFRFDPEVSIPVDDFGSEFRLGRLTGAESQGRLQILHLPPGGMIGRHRGGSRQLFAVVSGSGWVSGADGTRRPIGPGQAVVWEAGEEHAAGTEDGLAAVCFEGTFDMKAVAVTRDIVVADYDPRWPELFEQVRAFIWDAVKELALRIDHVGSTSVPGMAAKPIIDTDIVVADQAHVRPVIEALEAHGYQWVGNMGVEGREAFDSSGHPELPRHHLYLVVENNKAHLDHILLRDLLRADPEARQQYADLKHRNVELAKGDIDVYVAAKASLVAELLTRARAERGMEPATYWDPDVPRMRGSSAVASPRTGAT